MEFLEKNMDWLKGKLDALQGKFLLFDCPGQAELYTHHQSVQHILEQLQKWNYRVRYFAFLRFISWDKPSHFEQSI
jgi:hypothetical protein